MVLFDVKRQSWRKLFEGTATYPVWSKSGEYVYFLARGADYALSRVRAADGKVEQLLSLKGTRLTGLYAASWMGLTPQDEPLVLKDVGTSEIYALEWDAP